MKLWAPRSAQWAACSQHLRFYKRNRTEPERKRWKLHANVQLMKRNRAGPHEGSSGRHTRRNEQRAHNTYIFTGGAERSRSRTGGSSKERAKLMKRSRAGPREAPGATRGAVGSVLAAPAFSEAEPDGAGVEPVEAPRKTFNS